MKPSDDSLIESSFKDSIYKIGANTEFQSVCNELCKGTITSMTSTGKVSSIKVDLNTIGVQDIVVGNLRISIPLRIGQILQEFFRSSNYPTINLTFKERKRSEWRENITKKINDVEAKISLLLRYKVDVLL